MDRGTLSLYRERATWSIGHGDRKFWISLLVLSGLVGAGIYAYVYQVQRGLWVTGLNQKVSWGFYIINCVFFIGISYGGAMTSAILRLTNAKWRAPLTRLAEATAVAALLVGAVYPIIDLGRPDRIFNLLLYPQVGSPVIWDAVAISTYLVASLVFLYLPLIPDLAVTRDELRPGLLRRLYGLLALGWRGTPRQWHRLETAMQIMAIGIVPVAVSVHTIVSFDFSMATVPMWHSTIFGPYFVAGAIFSGIAALIVAMAALRKALHLEHYLLPLHFDNLG
ncbi:MAG: NrfD/PsrC family molybdoenzyme membrane anchor subunit, partial [Burkholderiales bacterium]